MTITEVFPKPTVKQVVFQIRFPNLFYIERNIGDFQIKVMKEFPNSNLAMRRQLVFADLGPNTKIEDALTGLQPQETQKIWQFTSDNEVQLNITSDSLDLSSKSHKTYNNPKSPIRFREAIKLVLDAFFSTTQIPVIKRIGLRYIDEINLPNKTNLAFQKLVNSSFPISRFPVEDSKEMVFQATVKRGKHNVRFMEMLNKRDNADILVLDFDGFSEEIDSSECLNVTDELHTLISDEFEKTIKDPVYAIMRGES